MKRYLVILAASAVALPAYAQAAGGPDFSTLTSAVDVTTVGTAILAVAALMVAPKVITVGVKWVSKMIPALGK